MNKWQPDSNPRQARRIGKTMEECGELVAVLARVSIQGLDAVDPATGKTNRQRLIEEVGDVYAQLACTVAVLRLPQAEINERSARKVGQMAEWEAHYTEN
jgi:NTP pyrophosphatase (non-canonical NTP hydrolase)